MWKPVKKGKHRFLALISSHGKKQEKKMADYLEDINSCNIKDFFLKCLLPQYGKEKHGINLRMKKMQDGFWMTNTFF